MCTLFMMYMNMYLDLRTLRARCEQEPTNPRRHREVPAELGRQLSVLRSKVQARWSEDTKSRFRFSAYASMPMLMQHESNDGDDCNE